MDMDKIKYFFINHIEKIVFGVVGVLACYMLFVGVNKPSYLATNKPDDLTRKANQVKLEMAEDHSSQIFAAEERQPSSQILERTAALFKPIDAPIYKPKVKWSGDVDSASVVRRRDPLLAPLKGLRTVGVSCVIAFNGAREKDAFAVAQLEDADPVEKKEKKKPKRRRRNAMMTEMEMEMAGMDMMMTPMTSMSSNVTRKLDSKFNLGHKPQSESATNNPQPRASWFIAGTALLPHKEIYEAFELALENADGYKTTRDVPIYFDFEVQRADVTEKSVEQLVEEEWKTVYERVDYVKLAAKFWSGFAPELVPKDYRDENLTIWIPPVLLDDYSNFCLHPEIPMISRDEKERQEARLLAGEEEEIDVNNITLGDDQVLTGPDGTGGGGIGAYGMDEEMMMMGGMRMYGAYGRVDADPVDHKLVRFYDFIALKRGIKPGRSYVYRLRYAVIDPNYPPLPQSQPKLSSLTPEVIQRVSAKMQETRETEERDYRLWSDWSEPSAPSKLPPISSLYAGPIETGSFNKVRLGGKQVEVPRDTPTAKVLLSEMDPQLNVRVPMTVEKVKEGAVLATSMKVADVINPISLEIKKVPEYQIVSGTSVIDLGGGRPLGIDEKLTSPGTMLLYDSNGDLVVTDDVNDQFQYRVYSYADEKGE